MSHFPRQAMRIHDLNIMLKLSGSPSIPTPAPLPPAAAPATMANPQVSQTAASQRARAAAAAGAGFAGTVGTTPEGLSAPPLTQPATLLGSTK